MCDISDTFIVLYNNSILVMYLFTQEIGDTFGRPSQAVETFPSGYACMC